MSLIARISLLASRIGLEVKTKIAANHPGVAKAWVCFGYVQGELFVYASHNVKSVRRRSVGRYRVTFATAMPDANYCWIAFARSSTNSASTPEVAFVRSSSDKKTAKYVDISCTTASQWFADSSEINLTVWR
jgi:hypothetical protein